MTLGQKIRELRAERGWTQLELAKHSGLDRGYIANLEIDNVNKPAAEVFLKLAHAFNIRPEELYQAAGYIEEIKTSSKNDESADQILNDIKLNVRKLEKILKGG